MKAKKGVEEISKLESKLNEVFNRENIVKDHFLTYISNIKECEMQIPCKKLLRHPKFKNIKFGISELQESLETLNCDYVSFDKKTMSIIISLIAERKTLKFYVRDNVDAKDIMQSLLDTQLLNEQEVLNISLELSLKGQNVYFVTLSSSSLALEVTKYFHVNNVMIKQGYTSVGIKNEITYRLIPNVSSRRRNKTVKKQKQDNNHKNESFTIIPSNKDFPPLSRELLV